jgi:hypothetical protein
MKKRLKCKYIFADNYNPVYVNGAYGGGNAKGEIVVNFYLERAALPNSQTYEIEENKLKEVLSEQDPQDLKESFVRFISTGIILDYKNAKVIHEWLGGHIKKIENSEIKEDKTIKPIKGFKAK